MATQRVETLKDKVEHWAAAYEPFMPTLCHLAVRELPDDGAALVFQCCRTGRELSSRVVVAGGSEGAFLLAANELELTFLQQLVLDKSRYRRIPVRVALEAYARVN